MPSGAFFYYGISYRTAIGLQLRCLLHRSKKYKADEPSPWPFSALYFPHLLPSKKRMVILEQSVELLVYNMKLKENRKGDANDHIPSLEGSTYRLMLLSDIRGGCSCRIAIKTYKSAAQQTISRNTEAGHQKEKYR